MSLIECPECKKQISDKALKCPQCGAPIAFISSPASTEPSLSRKGTKIRIILVLLAIITGVSYWFWRASTSNRAAPPSAGLSVGLRQPAKVVDEQVELKEGDYVSYSFALRTDARVQVQLNAQPKHVDVMLMTKEEADKFRQVSGSLVGGQYTYRQALSSKQVLRMDKTEILPKGEWTIIVMRPSEALLFQKATFVNVIVTVY